MIKRKILSGLFALPLILPISYGVKPGNCMPSPANGPYRHYDAGLVYAGSEERFREAARLYNQGLLGKIIPLDSEDTLQHDVDLLIQNGVSPNDIIKPEPSTDTFTNSITGEHAAKEYGLSSKAQISSTSHLGRIKTIEEYSGLDRGSDGYFGVNDGIDEEPFWQVGIQNPSSDVYRWGQCAKDSLRAYVFRATGIVVEVK